MRVYTLEFLLLFSFLLKFNTTRRADNFARILHLSLSLSLHIHTPSKVLFGPLCCFAFAFARRPICIDLGCRRRLAANCKFELFKLATSCCSPGKLSNCVCVRVECVCVCVLHTRTTTTTAAAFLFFVVSVSTVCFIAPLLLLTV